MYFLYCICICDISGSGFGPNLSSTPSSNTFSSCSRNMGSVLLSNIISSLDTGNLVYGGISMIITAISLVESSNGSVMFTTYTPTLETLI